MIFHRELTFREIGDEMVSLRRYRFFTPDLQRSFKLLESRDRHRLILVTIIQIIFGVLDLIGVAAIGVVTAITIRGIRSEAPGDRVSAIMSYVGLDSFSLRQQVVIVSLAAVLILTLKTLLSIFLLRRTLFYMSRKSAAISSELISKLLSQPLSFIKIESLQQRLFTLTTGVSNITVGVFANLVLIVSDATLLLVLLAGLYLVDPLVCISTLFVFSSVGLILYYFLHTKASQVGLENSKLTVSSNQKIIEVLSSFREINTKGSKEYYANLIRRQRNTLANYDAEIKFLPNVSKYTTEMTVVIGIALIAAIQFSRSDTNHAIAVLSVFIAASTRIAPAVMRLQQSTITIKSYLASSKPTLDLADQLNYVEKLEVQENKLSTIHLGFNPNLEVKNVSFKYPGESEFAIRELSLEIKSGSVTGFVGPSGGGKSTLVDLILGIVEPDGGSIQVSGMKSLEAIRSWPGAIGYVPQNVFVANTSIRNNICLGYSSTEVPEDLIWDALEKADLSDFVDSLEGKLDYEVGDNGGNLSGGQRQRLGIARALLSKPSLLILDEATSSLDAETENRISNSISNLKGNTTVLIIAHRLSTVRFADKVYYIEKGKINGEGTFEDLKRINKSFEVQASHMGL